MMEEEVRTYPVNQETTENGISVSVPWIQRQANGTVIARVHVTSPKHMSGELLLTEQDLSALDADERPLRTQVRRFWGYTTLRDVTAAHEQTARFDVGFRADIAATRGRCALAISIVRTFRLGEGPRAVGGPWVLKFPIADSAEVTAALKVEADRQEAAQRETAARENARLERLRQEEAQREAARLARLAAAQVAVEPPRAEADEEVATGTAERAAEREDERPGTGPGRGRVRGRFGRHERFPAGERPSRDVNAPAAEAAAAEVTAQSQVGQVEQQRFRQPSAEAVEPAPQPQPERTAELATDAILGPVKTAQEAVDAEQTAAGRTETPRPPIPPAAQEQPIPVPLPPPPPYVAPAEQSAAAITPPAADAQLEVQTEAAPATAETPKPARSRAPRRPRKPTTTEPGGPASVVVTEGVGGDLPGAAPSDGEAAASRDDKPGTES